MHGGICLKNREQISTYIFLQSIRRIRSLFVLLQNKKEKKKNADA